MQGHGYAQPVKQPPPPSWLVFLRVLFVAVGIFSCGFLTWAMLLRLAVVTRKSLDWGLFVAVLAADILGIVLLGTESGDDVHTAGGYLGIALVFGGLAVTVVYYLVADSRHFHQLRQAYEGRSAVSSSSPYLYPQPPAPFTATTLGQTPVPVQPPIPHTPVPQSPVVPPPPQRPAPARIDQVRAELDELSDYLRKHDGSRGGGHEGGR
ncbi:hypothetical protein J2Z21_006510 [Streptomyces griseochromogenes]|uniref:Integral membrane protein n=1 Tax=Streptomyces griseochromogenes TaxID=68214 RepID=A0A1B1B9S6_9ACTN|nr:hypothetical protein [Streptomyces griseochromogenes]ANP55529.1 hypothetical protein AVL59_43310 [Streptomyces griseochromogenes]MBP2053517.1 hypothetical protein [Streptomyces griseochromogenes]